MATRYGRGDYDDEEGGKDDEDSTLLAKDGILQLLARVKKATAKQAEKAVQCTDVIGDIRICRHIYKNVRDRKAAIKDFRNYLKFRREWGLDEMRIDLEGKAYDVRSLPHGEEAAKYLNWNFDAGSTVHGDVVHYYGPSDIIGLIDELGADRVREFMLAMYEMMSMQLQERCDKLRDMVKIVMFVDFQEYSLGDRCPEMSVILKRDLQPAIDLILPAAVRVCACLNLPEHLNIGVAGQNKSMESKGKLCAEYMAFSGLVCPCPTITEMIMECDDFIRNVDFLYRFDLRTLKNVIIPMLPHADHSDQLSVPSWGRAVRAIPVKKDQELAWEISVDQTFLPISSVSVSIVLLMSPGNRQGTYEKALLKDRKMFTATGVIGGEMLVEDDGVIAFLWENSASWHSFLGSKRVSYALIDLERAEDGELGDRRVQGLGRGGLVGKMCSCFKGNTEYQGVQQI